MSSGRRPVRRPRHVPWPDEPDATRLAEAALERAREATRTRHDLFLRLDALRAQFLADLEARRAPAAFTFVTTQQLTKRFGINAEALRRRILRSRQRIQRELERHLHRTTSDDDVIESLPWKGYRLNPVVVRVVDPSELPGPDDTSAGR